MVRIASVGEILTSIWAVKRASVRKETDVLRDELPLTARLSLLYQIKFTQVSSYLYGTLYPLVKQTLTGHSKGEPAARTYVPLVTPPGSWGGCRCRFPAMRPDL